jgi:hypothetical protein
MNLSRGFSHACAAAGAVGGHRNNTDSRRRNQPSPRGRQFVSVAMRAGRKPGRTLFNEGIER